MYTFSSYICSSHVNVIVTNIKIMSSDPLNNSPIFFTFALFPGEEPIHFFFFWGDGRVPYNDGNTARFPT